MASGERAFRAVVESIAVAEAVAGKATPEQRERFADQLLELYEERCHRRTQVF